MNYLKSVIKDYVFKNIFTVQYDVNLKKNRGKKNKKNESLLNISYNPVSEGYYNWMDQ